MYKNPRENLFKSHDPISNHQYASVEHPINIQRVEFECADRIWIDIRDGFE